MKSYCVTDVGVKRNMNQDFVYASDQPVGNLSNLYIVADGMGGHNAGDVASRMAVLLLGRVLEGATPDEALLRGGIEEVNLLMYEEQAKEASLSGMGTTMTVIWEDHERILLGHVGDSRAYRMRNGKMELLSQDHSMVAELVRNGIITEEQARTHPRRNVITRALGSEARVESDYFEFTLQSGDILLLCSDGLSNIVTDLEMLDYANEYQDPELLCRALMSKALNRGARDNVTVLAVMN